jgi:hypothetical protein
VRVVGVAGLLQSAIDSLRVEVERFLCCRAASSGSRAPQRSERKLSRAQYREFGNYIPVIGAVRVVLPHSIALKGADVVRI